MPYYLSRSFCCPAVLVTVMGVTGGGRGAGGAGGAGRLVLVGTDGKSDLAATTSASACIIPRRRTLFSDFSRLAWIQFLSLCSKHICKMTWRRRILSSVGESCVGDVWGGDISAKTSAATKLPPPSRACSPFRMRLSVNRAKWVMAAIIS